MLVKFVINPTGQFNLSYNLGEVVEIEKIKIKAKELRMLIYSKKMKLQVVIINLFF